MTRDKRRLVLSAGMPRSGSTWQFGVLRFLLASCGKVYSAWQDQYDPDNTAPIHIMKCHVLGSVPEDAEIVSCIRDVRAVAGSMVRMGWIKDDPLSVSSFAEDYVRQSRSLLARAGHVTRYEAMLDRPVAEIEKIQHYLGLCHDGQAIEVDQMIKALQPPQGPPTGDSDHVDPITQLHPGHIGGRSNTAAIAILSDESIRLVEQRCYAWLREMDYIPR